MIPERDLKAFADLVEVCRRLRGPDGCPWDREQTLESMTPYLVEEAVESGEAIASGDTDKIAEELGDLAFLAIFCLEILGERGVGLAEGLERAAAKLIRRHPHVYGDTRVEDGDAAYRQWRVEAVLTNREAANVQEMAGHAGITLPAGTTAGRGDIATAAAVDHTIGGAAAEDTTADRDLALTVAFGAANANLTIDCRAALLELL